jgi:hypothetical protein
MRALIYPLLFFLLFGCNNSDGIINKIARADSASDAKEKPTSVSAAKLIAKRVNFYVGISVPQNSGLAFVKYKTYEVKNDSFYISERFATDTTRKIKFLNQLFIDKDKIEKLKGAVAAIDSIGNLSNCHDSFFGRTRFFISLNVNGREKNGFVANIYRKNIFDVIDILNEISPTGKIIDYDKKELIQQEADCN